MYLYSIIGSMDEKDTISNSEEETFRLRFVIEDTNPITLHILSIDINQRNDKKPEFVEVCRWWSPEKQTNE